LCQDARVDINFEHGKDKETPLMVAIFHTLDGAIDLLLKDTTRINLNRTGGLSYLYCAIHNNYAYAVKQLLRLNPAEANDKISRLGETPAEFARRLGHEALAQMIDNFRRDAGDAATGE